MLMIGQEKQEKLQNLIDASLKEPVTLESLSSVDLPYVDHVIKESQVRHSIRHK